MPTDAESDECVDAEVEQQVVQNAFCNEAIPIYIAVSNK